jgi:SAM-dependent methyltransferase
MGPEGLIPLRAALDRLPSPPARVLDLGTGTGKAARLVAGRFPEAEVLGADLSPAMIEEAQELLPEELRGRVRFAVADADALPFEEGAFDLVVLQNMIPFFEELARVTAPGGTVLFAWTRGCETPIYVPSQTLRARLAPLGFGAFEELAAGRGDRVSCRPGEPPLGCPAKRRPRHGSTGPDVVFSTLRARISFRALLPAVRMRS